MNQTRGLRVFAGAPRETERRALALCDGEVLWVSQVALRATSGMLSVSPREAKGWLGGSFDWVVMDAHGRFDPDLLGILHGFARVGLIIRMDSPPEADRRLQLEGYPVGAVGRRFWGHVLRSLCAHGGGWSPQGGPHREVGTAEQLALVAQLSEALSVRGRRAWSLVAARGRGKSAALGLTLRALAQMSHRALAEKSEGGVGGRKIAIWCPQAHSFQAIARFYPGAEQLRIFGPGERPDADLVIVDEAAQLPLAVLRRLVEARPEAEFVFATTAGGYEGTGRGFVLRFEPFLAARRELVTLRLEAPIRWAEGDRLEGWVTEALFLSEGGRFEPGAQGGGVGAAGGGGTRPNQRHIDQLQSGRLHIRAWDREALVRDRARLAAVFGLLMHAHYRTQPSDFAWIMDAPNVRVYVAEAGEAAQRGRVVGVCVIALEGGLDAAHAQRVASGEPLKAHALADVLAAHCDLPRGAELRWVRSVRIAVDPAWRRLGVASRLAEAIHRAEPADGFGTLFGADAGLVAFRRSLGYVPLRLSASRGARTGEPSVMMLRPVSEAARAVCKQLGEAFRRDLPYQWQLLEADGAVMDKRLWWALAGEAGGAEGAGEAGEAEADRLRGEVRSYARGPRTAESVISALRFFYQAQPKEALAALDVLEPGAARLLERRLWALRGWEEASQAAGLPSARVGMRMMRRAMRQLLAWEDERDEA